MYSKLFDMLYSFNADTIEQAVDLGETLGYWEQYKDKNVTDRGMHIWHLQMAREVWEDLLSSRNGRKSISFPAPTRAHIWGLGLKRDDTIYESKIIKLTRSQLRRLIAETFAPTPGGDAALRVGQRSQVMDQDTVKHMSDIGKEDPYQAYELATMLGSEEQPPIENLDIDLSLEAILVSGKPELLETIGFTNLLRSISFDEKDRVAFRLAPERLEMAKYKAGVLNKPVEDLMEVRYSWWESGYYMTIEEWIKNNPGLVTSTILKSPYSNSEHILYDIKGVKMLHISSAESDSTYTI